MQAQLKRLHESDQITPVKQEGRRGRKGHGPREGEDANASGSRVLPPIERTEGSSKVSLQSEQPTPREPDDPPTTQNPTTTPIQRPDDPPCPSSFSGEVDYPISREPDDPKVTVNHTKVPIDREEPSSQASSLQQSGS